VPDELFGIQPPIHPHSSPTAILLVLTRLSRIRVCLICLDADQSGSQYRVSSDHHTRSTYLWYWRDWLESFRNGSAEVSDQEQTKKN
jgi:hypothetical protein